MIRRDYLENFLRLQDVPPSDPDDVLRDIFARARWRRDDIDKALLVLRGSELEDLYYDPTAYMLHTDVPVSPEMLSSLLGIDIRMQPHHLNKHQYYDEWRKRHHTETNWISMISAAVIGAMLALVLNYFIMYQLGIGPFFVPVAQFNI